MITIEMFWWRQTKPLQETLWISMFIFTECKSFQYKCENRICLTRAYLCDGFEDCGCNGCDEDGCSGLSFSEYYV